MYTGTRLPRLRGCRHAVATLAALVVCSGTHAQTDVAKLVDGLPWRCIGPAVMGGRIDDVAVVEQDPAVAYIATATGGLWKTTNHGTTYQSVFDEQPCQTIGAVAVSQTNPNVVWVGTGEANNRQSSSWGCGVFKSTDAGATWQHMGLTNTLHIARIVIHPTNPDIVYVAAVGHLWGPNEERGLYRTTDGGRTWKPILQINADTGCTDVAIDPANPSTVFAAMYQRRRAAWGFIGGGPHSAIYRSRDGGDTWEKLTKGLPAGDKGRIGLDIYRRDPRIVYAVVEARDGGVFRSDDHGDTWTRMSTTNPRPMYFSLIRVDPNDDQYVWLAGVSLSRSKDGGKTFGTEPAARLHADIHAIWIDPRDSRHMLVGCDGGIQWSHDRGQTWDHHNTIPLAQFYHVAFDMNMPYWVAGGLQDNGSWLGPSSLPAGRGPSNGDWVSIGGGDGFYCAIDWNDPNTVYSESQNGALQRVNRATGAAKSITPVPPAGEPRYRWDWCTPFMLSPHNPRKVLLGGNRLFISADRGDTWRRTEDLSTNPDISQFVLMGVKRGARYPFPDIGSDYGQIVTITESPVREGIIYVGTDDGNLQVSRDDGKTWTNVAHRIPGLPAGTYVSRVHASPHAEGRVYASFDGHRSDDYAPYIYVSDDYGTSWRRISEGIPNGSTVNVVRDHPFCENLLFAGTDRGLYVSFNRGGHWTRFGLPMPALRIDEVLVHPRDNDLIVATHARGIYILDDIATLVHASRGENGAIALLPPRPAVQYRSGFGMSSLTGNRQFMTRGAPSQAQLRYWLPKEPTLQDRLTLTVATRRGKIVHTRRLVLANAGYNTTTWDMRSDPPGDAGPAAPAATQSTETRQGRRRSARRPAQGAGGAASVTARGSRVPPGEYIVQLSWGEQVSRQVLTILPDPRVTLAPKDYQRLYDLCEDLLAAATAVRQMEARLSGLQQALTAALGTDAMKSAPETVKARAQGLLEEAVALRRRLTGTPSPGSAGTSPQAETLGPGGQVVTMPARSSTGLASLINRYRSALDSLPELPSRALMAEMQTVKKDADAVVREGRALVTGKLARLNRDLAAARLPGVVVQEAEPAEGGNVVEEDATREEMVEPDAS